MIKALIVDDDENLLIIMREALECNDFDVTSAKSGNEAIKILETESFDILVTDLYMDNGGGQQLIDWCKRKQPSLKILAVSGEKLDRIVTALDVAEDDGVSIMAKPFSLERFVAVLKGMVNNQFF